MRTLNILILALLFSISLAKAQEDKISYQSMDWMPNGDQIVFSAIKVKEDWSDYASDNWRLYMYDLTAKELTVLGNSILYFSISPDGNRIAYDRNTPSGKDIFVMHLDSGTSETVVASPAKDAGPSWSPDGTHLVFYSDRDGNEALYTAEVESGEITPLSSGDAGNSYNPQWDPNSDLIVYYLEKGDSKDQIYLTDSRGSFQKNLTEDDHHNIFPSWTPDGRIVYIRDKGEMMIMNADGTGKKTLSDDHVAGLIRVDRKGKKALITDGNSNLLILHLDTLVSELVIDMDTID